MIMMDMWSKVFIAKSLDGYIAGPNGEIDWLDPKPDENKPEDASGEDMGFGALMEEVDAIVMGRVTFEFVRDYDGAWPYLKPLYVLSNSLSEVPERLQDKVTLVLGSLSEALEKIHQNGHLKLYVDGGQVIHSFMKEDLIDEMFITTVPVVLGGGIPLFRDLPTRLEFQHVKSESFFGFYVQDHYKRLRK